MHREYHIVYSGKTEEGKDKHIIIQKIARALKAGDELITALEQGKPVILKRTNNPNQAKLLVNNLRKIGAIAEVKIVANKSELIPSLAQQELQVAVGKSQSPSKELKPQDSADKTQKINLKHKLQYKFDLFMAKGSSSSFKALLVVTLAIFFVIAGLRALLYVVNPALAQQYGDLDVLGNIYITFLQMTDPGNMAQDILSSIWYKLFAIFAGLTGVIVLSALIAVITTGLDQKLAELKRGRSKVIEQNHTLIIGWDEQRITEIIKEIVLANESEPDGCVVILADKDKQMMDDTVNQRLVDTATTRIVTRSGSGTALVNLDMVSIEHAKSVIILANCAETDTEDSKIASDALVIQTILACTTKSIEKDDYAIVAEVFNEPYRNIIQHTFPSYVVTLDTSNILAKLLVQTSRSTGLSVVYNEILSFDGCEMYFYHSDWNNKNFGELPYCFDDGVPIGIRSSDGEIHINPSASTKMKDDDEIVIIADDDSTIEFSGHGLITPKTYPNISHKLTKKIERELILGWNYKSEIIIREFSEYVTPGSQINVLLKTPKKQDLEEIDALNREFEEISIKLIDINPLNYDQLHSISPGKYDNIIILACIEDDKTTQQVDSENIVTLLLLRSIFRDNPQETQRTNLITEVLDSQNHALISQAGVKDMIISNRLVSMITAQISESRGVKDVYDHIFQEDGCEIYLKPTHLYFDSFPVTLRFVDLIARAQERDEVCFGVKIQSLEEDPDSNYGIKLVPPKDKQYTLESTDYLVVVAEDEL